MKVLVVEDQPAELKLARLVLGASGMDVEGVPAAEPAMAAIRHHRPHLILLDLELPGRNGLSLARQLKASPETRDICIVAITSYPERYPRAAALDAGCDAYVKKPLDTRQLPGFLRRMAAGESAPG
ncbi:MAG TPA: response regulator [Terriglobales bacterium]|nr:response regulator [Terriglobales bacterium]